MKNLPKILAIVFLATLFCAPRARAACVTDSVVDACVVATTVKAATITSPSITSSGAGMVATFNETFCPSGCSGAFHDNAKVTGCGGTWSKIAKAEDAGTNTVSDVFATGSSSSGSCTVTITTGANTEVLSMTVMDVPTLTSDWTDGIQSTNSATSSSATPDTGTVTTTLTNDLLADSLSLYGASGTATAVWSGSPSNTNGTPSQDNVGNFTGNFSAFNDLHQILSSATTYKMSQTVTWQSTGSWTGGQSALKLGGTCVADGIIIAHCVDAPQVEATSITAPSITSSGGTMVAVFNEAYCGTQVATCTGSIADSNTMAGCGGTWSKIASAHDTGINTVTDIFCAPTTTVGACSNAKVTVSAGTELVGMTVYDVPNGNGCTLDGTASSHNGATTTTIDGGTVTTTGTSDILFVGLTANQNVSSTNSLNFYWATNLVDTNGTPITDNQTNWVNSTQSPSTAVRGHQHLTSATTYQNSQTTNTSTSGLFSGAQVAIQLNSTATATPTATPTPTPTPTPTATPTATATPSASHGNIGMGGYPVPNGYMTPTGYGSVHPNGGFNYGDREGSGYVGP